jgi:hypothetical protein
MNLVSQLAAIADHATKMTEEEQRQKAAWQLRKDRGLSHRATGLTDALRQRLPIGAEAAITKSEIRALIPDIPYADHGLSATLTHLQQRGEIFKVGEFLNYRYYRKS